MLSSVLGILACCFCLAGATWAWFTESASSGIDAIESSSYSLTSSIVEAAPVETAAIETQSVETQPVETTPVETAAPETEVTEAPAEDNSMVLLSDGVDTGTVEETAVPDASGEVAETAVPEATDAVPAENTDTGTVAANAETPTVTESPTPSVQALDAGCYLLAAGKKYTVTLTSAGNAATGGCKIILNGTVYYSAQFVKGNTLTFTIDCTSAGGPVQVSFTPYWGTYSGCRSADLLEWGEEIFP